jgi:tRNA-dihydrouridine synthase
MSSLATKYTATSDAAAVSELESERKEETSTAAIGATSSDSDGPPDAIIVNIASSLAAMPCSESTRTEIPHNSTHPQHVVDAWKWFHSHGSPRYWVAPLVGLSDKSFRILCRRHGAHMCHTEMTDPGGFARSDFYRTQALGIERENDGKLDRPLVLQLGSSHIPKLLEAIRVAVSLQRVDAIELNCGCPQQCARKGNYGSFLLDPPRQTTLLHIIRTIRNSQELPQDMPLLVKMRVLESIGDTADLAKRIVEAGAGILTVHGRTRHQGGGSKTSGKDYERLASWPHIRAVKEAVHVPVIANGNVPNRQALSEILKATGCDGVMSGVGILRDPTLFDAARLEEDDDMDEDASWYTAVQTAMEYLALAMTYHTHPTRVSKHLTWMLDGKGFKSRAPLAREEALKLRFVRNCERRGSDSTCRSGFRQTRPRSNQKASLLWLGRCLSISIFLYLRHCSMHGVEAFNVNGRSHPCIPSPFHATHDNPSVKNSDIHSLDIGMSRQSALATFRSIAIVSLLSASTPSMTNAKETADPMNSESVPTIDTLPEFIPSLSSATSTTVSTKITSSTSFQEGISGFVAGAALTTTKTLVKFPLDTATVRLQQVNNTSIEKNPVNLFQDCYNGVTVTLLSNIPAGAVFFAVKDGVKGILKQSEWFLPRWLSTCVAVAIAQIPYWVVRNPSEVIKVRQQANVYDDGSNSTASAFQIIQQTLNEQQTSGIADLYTGYWENILYAFPADVLKFVVYEMITQGNKDLSPLEGAEAGALATAIAQLVTTPLDVIRNRLMMKVPSSQQEDEASNNSYLDSLIRLGKDEGLEGLFAGVTPRVGKAILSGAIQFATYEETKQTIMKLLTGQS